MYQEIGTKTLNPFLPNIHFPYHLKTSENQWFPHIFSCTKREQ